MGEVTALHKGDNFTATISGVVSFIHPDGKAIGIEHGGVVRSLPLKFLQNVEVLQPPLPQGIGAVIHAADRDWVRVSPNDWVCYSAADRDILHASLFRDPYFDGIYYTVIREGIDTPKEGV